MCNEEKSILSFVFYSKSYTDWEIPINFNFYLKYLCISLKIYSRNNELKQTVCILLSKRLNKDNIVFSENSLEGWKN